MRELLRLLAIRVRTRGRVVAARSVRVSAGVRVTAARGARVVIEPCAVLGAHARVDAVGGTVRIGAGAQLGERAQIVAHAGAELGPGALLGQWAAIEGGAPTWDDVERPLREQALVLGPVTVGAGAVVGPHAVLGPGTVIAPGARVAPYAVVPARERTSPA